jgi:hypothetical protein
MLTILKVLLLFMGQVDKLPSCDTCSSLVISYEVQIQSKNRNKSTAELFNGSSKVVFINSDTIRVRQVSLLRTESAWFYRRDGNYSGIIIKESSKDQNSYSISLAEWRKSFSSWENADFLKETQTQTIAGYKCKRAVLVGENSQRMVVYYTNQLRHDAYKIAEPMFSAVPGIVLKYEFRSRESVITYIATRISVR